MNEQEINLRKLGFSMALRIKVIWIVNERNPRCPNSDQCLCKSENLARNLNAPSVTPKWDRLHVSNNPRVS
ncbi:hypothetical protein L2E82_14800 [Cichorium intybus]|uniref:Uncharacterized protein n=1 Tax=Cichorium intybus TaxID=13427 RepID=A0ACB9F0F5_CICIN|nr:hypothetical protein L2E82_14800 [Cichorium intybus]